MRATDTFKSRAQGMFSMFLQRISTPGSQAAIAEGVGISESSFSRLKNDQMLIVFEAVARAGLKLVPQDEMTYSNEQVKALACLAKLGLEHFPTSNNQNHE